MAAVMWIEVFGRDGEVVARERIDTAEARVGRAFDNDVVLNDPHVAPHHLRVLRGEDGALVAEDLGTRNGLYAEHGAQRVARLVLGRDPGLRIGRTTLRVMTTAVNSAISCATTVTISSTFEVCEAREATPSTVALLPSRTASCSATAFVASSLVCGLILLV